MLYTHNQKTQTKKRKQKTICRCPEGEDTDCPGGMGCFGNTGCFYDEDLVPTGTPIEQPSMSPTTAAPIAYGDPKNVRFCVSYNNWYFKKYMLLSLLPWQTTYSSLNILSICCAYRVWHGHLPWHIVASRHIVQVEQSEYSNVFLAFGCIRFI